MPPINRYFCHPIEKLFTFQTAFDYEEALQQGVIAPSSGVDHEYDAAVAEIASIDIELASYLKQQEKHFKCRITYFGADKKRFQLEIPERDAKRADSSYALEGQRKGTKPTKRYHTEETRVSSRKEACCLCKTTLN